MEGRVKRPRQKGLRQAYLKRFAANNVHTKGRIDQEKMNTDPWYAYNERAATIGAKEMVRFESWVERGEPMIAVAETKVDDVPCHPHKTVYTRGKGNELNSSVPRVWTLAKLYQGNLRMQQQVRCNYVDLFRHPHGGIRMFFTIDSFMFVEINTQRNIERRSKTYPSRSRAMSAFKLGTITWLKSDAS